MLTWLEPQPTREERPLRFPSPFDDVPPHPLAQRCAELVMDRLRKGFIAPGFPTALLERRDGGKMFGVLVVEAPDGRVGFFRAVSGQVERSWHLQGYALPVFDAQLRSANEGPAEAVVKALTARVDAMRANSNLLEARAALVSLDARHQQERRLRKERLAQHRHERQLARAEISIQDTRALYAIDQLSRADDAERRRAEAKAREELAAAQALLFPLERRLAALERLRRIVSREAIRSIWDSYVLTDFNQRRAPLRSLFPQGDPSSGAGDCAAPKLLAAAQAAGLRPLALAEFWWGAAPPGGARVEGMYFPACKEKCGPVLAFMLQGLQVAPREIWKPRKISDDALAIVAHHERFLVLNKPEGMLSVPARDASVTDNLVARVRRHFPNARGPIAVHRLDLDTSGLMLVALDEEMYHLLQHQFLSREVTKQYVAVVEGSLVADEGVIELPLRVDLEQRPRQMVDFQHGKSALTKWKVIAREECRTRVSFFPVTGRTHQLRVHASHHLGLNTPIVGDRLYGKPGPRLMLHAEGLSFRHPLTGELLSLEAPAPF